MATLTRNPTSDIAVSGDWTGTAGSRYTLVDDYPSQDTLDQLTHGTTAGQILFGYDSVSIGTDNAIESVKINYYDREASNGPNNAAAALRIGGVDYSAATHQVSTTTTLRTDTFTTNPRTGVAWTVADVNGTGSNNLSAFGLVSTDANPAVSFTSIQMEVTYFTAYRMTADVVSFAWTRNNADFRYFKMTADTGYVNVSGTQGYLLDSFSGAQAAFSLRKLRNGYTGACIRVQRSSDNTEEDIGFGSDGFLNETALTTFVGSSTGRVVTWYDQSTNGWNAVTSGLAPIITNTSGVIYKINSKPAVLFNGASVGGFTPCLSLSSGDSSHLNIYRNVGYAHMFSVWASSTTTDAIRVVFVAENNASQARARIGHNSGARESVNGRRVDGSNTAFVSASGAPTTDQFIVSGLLNYADATAFLYRNNSLVASSLAFQTAGNTSDTASSAVRIGRLGTTTVSPWNGYIQEIVAYNTDQQAVRFGIENNANADWSTYSTSPTATLGYNRTITADPGTFTLTGVDVTLTVAAGTNYSITADVGTFTLTGEDAALQYARIFSADTVSYSLTGIDANFIRVYQFPVDVTTYTLAGQDVTLVKEEAMTMFASHGDFVVTANDANLIYPRSMTADAVSFTLTGQDAGVVVARQLSADLATYAFTGQDAIVRRGYPLTAGAGTFTVTTYEAQFVLVRANKGNLIAFFL